jgi:hypothetical protein
VEEVYPPTPILLFRFTGEAMHRCDAASVVSCETPADVINSFNAKAGWMVQMN